LQIVSVRLEPSEILLTHLYISTVHYQILEELPLNIGIYRVPHTLLTHVMRETSGKV
jgi:hypothetical protein